MIRRFLAVVFPLVLGLLMLRAAEPAPPATEAPPAGFPTARESLHVFLLMGQSNMAGSGCCNPSDPWQPGDKEPVPGIFILGGEGRVNDAKPVGPVRWRAGAHPVHVAQGYECFSLGIDFAKTYMARHPGVKVGLVPCAWGGAGIDGLKKGSKIYENALLRAAEAEKVGVIRGVLWHQGESDTVSDALAGAYAGKLDRLVADLRADLRRPDLPFVAGELARFYGTGKGHSAPERVARIGIVRRATLELPTRVAHTAVVTSEGLSSVDANQVHFNRASYVELGRRYAAAFAAAESATAPTMPAP